MQQTAFRPRGFTLIELFGVLLVISITAATLFPVVDMIASAPARLERRQQMRCLSNLKQLGAAALAYAQDFDDTLPLVAQVTGARKNEPWSGWSSSWLGATLRDPMPTLYRVSPNTENGLLWAYDGDNTIYSCPATQSDGKYGKLYRINDLCGGAKPRDFANPARTVMLTDGDYSYGAVNIGHSYYLRTLPRSQHTLSPSTWFGEGETVGDAVIRHNGGANYSLADGHVQWFKPDAVFFPSGDSKNKAHHDPKTSETIGPNPVGGMTYNGKHYAATFHLR